MNRRGFIRGVAGAVAAAIVPWQIAPEAGLSAQYVAADGSRLLTLDWQLTSLSIRHPSDDELWELTEPGRFPHVPAHRCDNEYHVYEKEQVQ